MAAQECWLMRGQAHALGALEQKQQKQRERVRPFGTVFVDERQAERATSCAQSVKSGGGHTSSPSYRGAIGPPHTRRSSSNIRPDQLTPEPRHLSYPRHA
eukprot:1890832-Pleurochrysis_carterae.AAC.2